MSLKEYKAKRRFSQTPEPSGKLRKNSGELKFVVQMHAATQLHYDFRIELDGVLKSWAVPKGPSLNPMNQRLAVQVEDHPLEYGKFEGIIPSGNYGAGTVMVWDTGTYLERGSKNRKESEIALRRGFEKGHLTLLLDGQKLKGEFALIRLKKSNDQKAWLLIKKRDGYSSNKGEITSEDRSVISHRSLEEIASESPSRGDIWGPKRESKRSPIPHKINVMTSTASPLASFDKKGWLFERSWEGLRALAVIEKKGTAHIYSKGFLSFDDKFPKIVAALKQIGDPMILDGEIVRDKNPYFVVQDLLYLESSDLRHLPLLERKRRLGKLSIFGTRIRKNEFELEQGISFGSKAMDSGALFIYAKNAKSVYRSGISKDWLKIKVKSQPSLIEKPSEKPLLTNLSKIYWPKENYTKGDLVEYYRSVAPYILPYLKDRPESLNRYPNGIDGKHFYHKDLTGYLPRWFKTANIYSESTSKTIHYALCQNEASLLYLVNLGCIELNPWSSRINSLDEPDFVIIDLDPDDTNDFDDVITAAKTTHQILKSLGATAYCKTSGSTGIHICVPLQPGHSYTNARDFARLVCEQVHKRMPAITSLERNPARRKNKIYLDFLQNSRGQTLAAPYCVRPRPGAPVSTPLEWRELKTGLRPGDFTVNNILNRLKRVGDLWKPMLGKGIEIKKCLKKLST